MSARSHHTAYMYTWACRSLNGDLCMLACCALCFYAYCVCSSSSSSYGINIKMPAQIVIALYFICRYVYRVGFFFPFSLLGAQTHRANPISKTFVKKNSNIFLFLRLSNTHTHIQIYVNLNRN